MDPFQHLYPQNHSRRRLSNFGLSGLKQSGELLLSVMTTKYRTLTKMNLKHQVQCSHNNRGFCRFRDKCYYPHFTKACSKKVCRDQACLFRHPKSCKFGEDCKFYKKKICAFKHAETDKELAKIKKEINDFEEEVMMLKGDISNLKDIIKTKEEDLEAKLAAEAEQLKLKTDLSRENEELKSIIAHYRN